MDRNLQTKKRLLSPYLNGGIMEEGHKHIPTFLTAFYPISYKHKALIFGSKFTLQQNFDQIKSNCVA